MDTKRKNKILKAGIGYTVGNYLIKGLSVLTLPIFTRMMTTSNYGIYNSFSAYSNLLFIFVGLAIHSSYRNSKLKYGNSNYLSYISTTMLLMIFNLFIWIIFGILFGKQIGSLLGLNSQIILVLIVYSFSLAVITCFNTFSSIDYNYKAFLLIAGINAVSSIILSMILIRFVFIKETYVGRTLGTVIPSLLISVGLVVYFLKKSVPKRENIFPYLKWGIRYSIPIVPHGVSQLILAQFDRIMILKMIGAAVTGIYSFAYNIFSIIVVTTTSLDNVWSTWFYEKMHVNDLRSIKKYSSLYAGGICAYSIVLMLLSPEIVRILGPNEYATSVYAVIPLITGGFFSYLYTLPAAVEYYYEKTKFIMIGTILAAILNIVLNLIFLKKYGYVAAAYTTLVTYVAYCLLHFCIARYIFKKSLFNLKLLLFLSLLIIVVNFISVFLIKFFIIRLVLIIIILITIFSYEEKNLGIIKKKFTL